MRGTTSSRCSSAARCSATGEGRSRRDAETEAARERSRSTLDGPSGRPHECAARLTALRLVGFKSFAEKTTVEFGPGISAVVGPNGSGKSNLADALRWTLGRAGPDAAHAARGGRDLRRLIVAQGDRHGRRDAGDRQRGPAPARRLRRGRDRSAAVSLGRERVPAQSPADPAARPGRAARRRQPGRQRVPVHRPGHGRPGAGAAAGGAPAAVRGGGRRAPPRKRRRRQAEAELAEAESNLERLRDLLAELRPQARRSRRQAEQLQARRTAGVELAEALLDSARARWISRSRARRVANRPRWRLPTQPRTPRSPTCTAPREAASTTSEQMASHAEAGAGASRGARGTSSADRGVACCAGTDRAQSWARVGRARPKGSPPSGSVLETRLRDAAISAHAPVPQPDPALVGGARVARGQLERRGQSTACPRMTAQRALIARRA